jgi:two-component system, cell cycle sensor histidine kinase and response regulator CckA
MFRQWLLSVVLAALVIVTLFVLGILPTQVLSSTNEINLTFYAPLMAVIIGGLLLYLTAGLRGSFGRGLDAVIEESKELERLSTALLRLSSSKVLFSGNTQESIQEILHLAAITLDIERVSLWRLTEDFTETRCLKLYQKSTGQYPAAAQVSIKTPSRCLEILKSNRVFSSENVLNDPLTAEIQEMLHGRQITSLMVSAIYLNGQLFGFLAFAHIEAAHSFRPSEKGFASSLADMMATVFEVANRKKIEGELERKSQAIEASIDGIAIIDSDGRFSFVNKALAEMYGYHSPELLLGKSWRSLYDPKDLILFDRYILGNFKRSGNLQIEAIGQRPNGSCFPQELSLTALKDGSLICVVRNITTRKEAEQRLIENQRLLRTVIDSDPNFIFVKDEGGRFTLVNKAVADAYGSTPEKLLGKTDADFNAQNDEVVHFRSDDSYVLRSGKPLLIPEEQITDAQGGLRWLQTVKLPLRVPGSSSIHLLGVSTDITERKQLQDQLLHTQKMDALGQLAGGIAHDFNNMMTGILGYTTLLKMSSAESPDVYRSADLIEQAASRAADMTQKLLGFARKGKHQNVRTNLHQTIKETVDLLARTFETHIQLELDLQAGNPFVMGDPTQLQQVLLNLAINGRDSMNPEYGGVQGGTLRIASRTVGNDLLIESGQPGQSPTTCLEITVSDTGCGIAEEHFDKIFEPFFTTKKEGRGSGMGLAMVYGIVRNHSGSVQVDSRVGHGSSFKVKLPNASVPLSAAVEHAVELPTTGKGTILLVDDHQIVREVTVEMLITLGYKVETAADGREAVDYYCIHSREIDLVVLDLVMPRMGAKECLEKLKETNPDVRVVLCTGYGNNNAVQELLAQGVSGFVLKPYRLADLSKVIAQALNHKVISSLEPDAGQDEPPTLSRFDA